MKVLTPGMLEGLQYISILLSHGKTWASSNSQGIKHTHQPQANPSGCETTLDARRHVSAPRDEGPWLETETSGEICSQPSGQGFGDTETCPAFVPAFILASHASHRWGGLPILASKTGKTEQRRNPMADAPRCHH